jgi:hypothetical protein
MWGSGRGSFYSEGTYTGRVYVRLTLGSLCLLMAIGGMLAENKSAGC